MARKYGRKMHGLGAMKDMMSWNVLIAAGVGYVIGVAVANRMSKKKAEEAAKTNGLGYGMYNSPAANLLMGLGAMRNSPARDLMI